MRVLALEPFYGGSHQSFLDGWQSHSRHEITILGLPAYMWKWRMRHAAVTMAHRLREPTYRDQTWDAVWCSDMLNLAEFIGLAPNRLRELPRVAYFHENQLTYPVRNPDERDLHFAFSNFTTAIAADQVWFNSQFHLDDFLTALRSYLSRMPDYRSLEEVDAIQAKCAVQYPGIHAFPLRRSRDSGPFRICWNARWEHDKNPELFFAALRILKYEQVDFRLIVLGESFRNSPQVFENAKREFCNEMEHWGYAESVETYHRLLGRADVIVSTASHEFFGIGIVEGIAAGAIPLLPDQLAYPEVLSRLRLQTSPFNALYDGSASKLAGRLHSISDAIDSAATILGVQQMQQTTKQFTWVNRAEQLDDCIAKLD